MQTIDRQLVRQRFLRSLATYDAHATAQHTTAVRLVELVAETIGRRRINRVLELGCGTGVLTRELLAHVDVGELIANDLVPEFAGRIEEVRSGTSDTPHTFLPGDMEEVPLPTDVGLVVSNAALHWLERPGELYARLGPALAPGGYLAVSCFGPGTLREIAAIEGVALRYLPLAGHVRCLRHDFELLLAEEDDIVLQFDTPADVLRHLKLTGVTGTRRQAWTRRDLGRFEREYARLFATADGVRLSYRPLYFVARASRAVPQTA